MCDENIEIGVTEITNNILVSAQPTDQIIDINVLEEVENVELTITPSVVEVNIDVTQELITEIVTVDANTCVNIVDVTVTDATDNVTLNITPSLVEVNINRGENNLSIEEYESFADLPTIGDTDTYYITLDDNKFWRWDSIDEVYVEISSADDRIPYLGAIKNADLGEWGMKAGWLGFDTTPTNPPTAVGTLSWNDTDGTADLILKGGNVTLQIGQEEVVRIVNKTGATLNEADFRAVRIRSVAEGGAQGQRLAVVLAQGNNDANSATTIGLVTESISNNQEGFITTSGEVKKINTTGAKSYLGAETWVDGDILYLSPTHAGYLTNVKPQAPDHTIIIGWVVYAHANNGKIFVKVDNGYELDELHNVKITSPTNNQGLVYDSALSVWKNASIQLPLSATSPLSIASNVLSITKADATTDGYLSSADWNYFSAKQQPLSGTGFVKATGSVISYDNTIYTPQSRTLTINGTSYDLSADRSWSISVGSGMRNVSSFVATSGQTTFTIVGGYTAGLVDVFVNGVRLNGGDYTATNGTTVVLSVGAIANDLVDIINYTASLTSGLTGSGTTNYIPKWSGSTNLTNSQLFDNGSNVGVGTASPTKKLTIYGNVVGEAAQLKLSGISSINNQATYLGGYGVGAIWSSGGTYLFSGGGWVADSANNTIANIGMHTENANSYIYFSATNTNNSAPNELMRILGNGNVAIGLTNPSYKLDVNGDVNITGTYRVNGVAIGTGGGTVTGTGTTNYIAKWSGTSAIGNSLIYDNGTNVGIGTASPSYALHVYNTTSNARLAIEGTTNFVTTQHTNSSGSFYLGIDDSAGANFTGTGYGRFLYSAGAYPLVLLTNSTERLRIESNGNLTIPWLNQMTQIMNFDNSYRMGTLYQANARTLTFFSCGNDGNPSITFNTRLGAGSSSTDYGTEKMRITSGGRVLIATTSLQDSYLNIDGGAAVTCISTFQNGSGSLYHYAVKNSNGYVGGISSLGSMTLFNTTSDYRLKEDFKSFNGLDKINKINVYDFKWKNSEERMDGVIAHELQEIIPYAVSGKKDGKYMQGVDYSKIVPVLVQAIKELNAKLEAK